MVGPKDVADLLVRIRAARSPLARLKVVVAGWRTLQGMTPPERKNLASEIGMEGAEGLVERLASRAGLDPGVVLDAVKEAETRDPRRLRDLLQRPAGPSEHPSEPKDLLTRGLEALESLVLTGTLGAKPPTAPEASNAGGEADVEATAEEPFGPSPPPPVVALTSDSPPTRDGGGDGPEPAPVEQEPAPPARISAPSRDRPEAAADAPSRAATETSGHEDRNEPPATVAAQATRRSEVPSASSPPLAAADRTELGRSPTVATPQSVPATVVFGEAGAENAAPPRPPAQHSRAVPVESFIAEIDASPTLFGRLLVVDDHDATLAGLSAAEATALLERFEIAWARRRVVAAILEAGGLPDTTDALALVDELDSRRDRRWCLSVLLHTREFAEKDVKLVASELGGFGERLFGAGS